MSRAELLSPAGDFQTALAAFAAGADAVYCGLAEFSARAYARNLTVGELSDLVAVARKSGRRVYVTFNTLIDEDRLGDAVEGLSRIAEVGPDGLIVQDIGVASLVRRHFPSLELHASTQMVAHNLEGALALKELGFRRVVLARELSLPEIAAIARSCGARRTCDDGRPELELEVFVHGALCYSISGLCLFGAMENGRSGNRGTCPYCCRGKVSSRTHVPAASRVPRDAPTALHPFSMKDLRLGEDARRLVEAGVTSLKIEGRMKSSLYVASVTRHYRDILDGAPQRVSPSDLETVFSRRTTKLYFDGRDDAASPVDPGTPGHLGAYVGVVKKVTRDRDGRSWLRFHALRGLEKHDGLQFDATGADGRHLGLGVGEMRLAISRSPVFEAAAGSDVEVLLPDEAGLADRLRPGQGVYCSMSNAVRRMFPAPSFRSGECDGGCAVDVRVSLRRDSAAASARMCGEAWSEAGTASASTTGLSLSPARTPERTEGAVRNAFAKLGGTGYRLRGLVVDDPDGLFAPASRLNELRRDLVADLDRIRGEARRAKVGAAMRDVAVAGGADVAPAPAKTVKIRPEQPVPDGEWDEVVVAVGAETEDAGVIAVADAAGGWSGVRVALPVYTPEPSFGRLRRMVKRLRRAGCGKWECADLATLRLLRALGVDDITADWTLPAFNAPALGALSSLGVRRFVASPENGTANLRFLAESGFAVEFLVRQSTPLFVSLTKPADYESDAIRSFRRDGLWVTTRTSPRAFDRPPGASTRLDLSWDPPSC